MHQKQSWEKTVFQVYPKAMPFFLIHSQNCQRTPNSPACTLQLIPARNRLQSPHTWSCGLGGAEKEASNCFSALYQAGFTGHVLFTDMNAWVLLQEVESKGEMAFFIWLIVGVLFADNKPLMWPFISE